VAAASLVSGWASEEASGRLEMLLAGPLARAIWVVRSGLAVLAAVASMAAIVAASVGLATIGLGEDPLPPTVGAFVLALYGGAWAGVGIAVAGLSRPGLGAPVVVALTIGTFLLAIVAPALDLPAWVADLALNSHYGRPLIGQWDALGVIASLVLAFGGLVVGAFGLARRDVRG
jgi:ABC-2 type transport system permease protein